MRGPNEVEHSFQPCSQPHPDCLCSASPPISMNIVWLLIGREAGLSFWKYIPSRFSKAPCDGFQPVVITRQPSSRRLTDCKYAWNSMAGLCVRMMLRPSSTRKTTSRARTVVLCVKSGKWVNWRLAMLPLPPSRAWTSSAAAGTCFHPHRHTARKGRLYLTAVSDVWQGRFCTAVKWGFGSIVTSMAGLMAHPEQSCLHSIDTSRGFIPSVTSIHQIIPLSFS